MNDALRRRTDKLNREKVFKEENKNDFPSDSPVDTLSVRIDELLDEILVRDAQLEETLGDKRQAKAISDEKRDLLIGELEDVRDAAIVVGDTEVAGITAKFKMPSSRSNQNLIAAGTAFYNDSAPPLDDTLVTKGSLNAGFREEIQTANNEFQQARANFDAAVEEHGEAVGALDSLVREAMSLSRRRSAAVKLKYKNNPGKLASWAIASHLERPPKPAPKP